MFVLFILLLHSTMFDTIWRNTLFYKLTQIGVGGNLLKFFTGHAFKCFTFCQMRGQMNKSS